MDFQTVNIKTLSINEAFQGKRFKTPLYKKYEEIVLIMLPKIKMPNPPFKLTIEIGFSNKLADIDNPLKPILDILQKKYGINDRDVYELRVKKEIVKKQEEYFKFKIETLW